MGVSFFKNMFVKETPIKLLIEHAKILEDVCKTATELVNDYFKGKDISEKVKYISDQESKADDLKFDIRKLIAKNYKTPYSASDVLNYLHNQETLVDLFEDVAKKLSLNKLDLQDDKIIEKFMELVKQAEKSVDFLENMVRELQKVIDTSYANRYVKREKKEISKVEDIEGEADKISLELGKWIYSQKNNINPIDLIFFRELILIFVKITDVAENTAEVLYAFLNK
jgi:predicted phosphate transport protein (TIGR00153 family)